MSTVVKKEDADKLVFKHNPKFIRLQPSESANQFVNLQGGKSSDFQIADVVAQQTGISALKQKQVDEDVENKVLDKLKDIQESAYKAAYDMGIIEGNEKAFNEKQQDLQMRADRLDELFKNMDSHLVISARQSEAAIVKLIFHVAERIARRAVEQDPAPILEMLRNTIHDLQEAQRIVVQINPGDFKFIEDLRAKKEKSVEPLERVKFEINDRIMSGGCLIETDFGTIDATIEQRIERAWQALSAKTPITKNDSSGQGQGS